MNAALGFDTFLVVRHGMKRANPSAMDTGETGAPSSSAAAPAPAAAAAAAAASWKSSIPGDELGCYFCNDVVAPGDVSKERRYKSNVSPIRVDDVTLDDVRVTSWA